MATSRRHSTQVVHSRHSSGSSTYQTPDQLMDIFHEKAQRAKKQANERQAQSSPIAPSDAKINPQPRRASGPLGPSPMGVRESQQYIDRITKENWALKLEIMQQRKQNEQLEARLQKAAILETKFQELHQANENLRQELVKRDRALEEAFDVICHLEAMSEFPKNNCQLGAKSESNKGKTSNSLLNLPAVSHTESVIASDPISQHSKETSHVSEPKEGGDDLMFRRTPSPTKVSKPGSSLLQHLIQSNDTSSTDQARKLAVASMLSLRTVDSVLSQDEGIVDEDAYMPMHRTISKMSLLSESSFVSVYGKKNQSMTPGKAQHDTVAASPAPDDDISLAYRASQDEKRIKAEIVAKEHPATPTKKPAQKLAQNQKHDTFSSIGEILQPNQLSPQDVPPTPPSKSTVYRRPLKLKPLEKPAGELSLAGPIFGHPVLPPTPGTMRNSEDLSSNDSIIVSKGTRISNNHVLRRKRAFYEDDERW
ncbi:MAG: hypothetical protein Q9181_003700 [Wetmoreana brouardii]